uniref:Prominin 2 n=1 Tax=Strix occidentalis caurina TaxID=311401 RepID=A0A8D0KT04_STROC
MLGVAKQAWDGLGDASTQPRQAQPPRGARQGNKPRQRLGFARRPTRQAGFPEQRAEPERDPSWAGHDPPPARRLTEPPGSLLAAEAMRAAGLLLAWALLCPAGTQQCHLTSPSGVLRFTDTHAEIRVPALHRVPSSLDPLYGLVRHCLDLIQQNPLPTGDWVHWCRLGSPVTQVVQYELGYVVCAAVALLFTVAVPVAGMCFCYCRSRRQCGGRLRAHRRSLGCRRHCLLACLSLTSLVILVICAFVTSQRVKGQMEPGLGAVPATLRTLRQHITNVPQMVVDQFEVPRQQIISDLDLQTSLHHLQILDKTVRALAAARAELEPALRERRRRVVVLLDDPRCTSCASVLGRAQSLELGADYSKVPSVEKVLKALAGLPRSDFAEMIRQGNGTFNSIPELAVERMAQVIQEKVQSIADSFPLPDYTQPVSEALVKAEDRSQPYLREVERFEHYRWIAGTVLCSIILLILTCNVTGMALGAYGLSKREDPSDYERRGEAGAKFLLVGVGLAFLFSWLLILLVFATFLVGGNIQTLVCRNWVNQEIYKFIDTPGNLPPSMNLTRQLNLRRDSNLSAVECKSGAGLWEVLQLKRSYDLDEHLKTPKLVPAAVGRMWPNHSRAGLQGWFWSTTNSIFPQMKNPVVQTSLSGLARSLEALQKMQVSSRLVGVGLELCWEARHLPSMLPSLCPGDRLLHEEGAAVLRTVPELGRADGRCSSLWDSLGPGALMDAGCKPLAEPRQQDASPEARSGFMPCLHFLFQLREDVASCQPLATALDNGRVILCDRIADPWNAFWFSLGCCTFFLIPNIIFAVRLTKHFRPIRNRLISTGSEETCPFHIPRVTALKL